VYGRIARVDVDADPPVFETVIQTPTHLSYPFTFEEEHVTYCAPEMAASGGCTIYRLDAGGAWTPAHHILAGHRLVDPTFVRHNGRWWLFATDRSGGGSLTLHVFHADAIAGPWTPHQRNPVKVDRASARPAGRPFAIGEQLYRPAQDCRIGYGAAVHVMRIDELTPEAFREETVLRLEPDPGWPYPDGLHTLVIDGRRVYIDAKRSHHDAFRWLKVWTVSEWEARR
jgi:hypothetical protein